MGKDSSDVGSTSAATTVPPKAKSEWPEAQPGWIPIGRAVFRFGIVDPDAPTTNKTHPTGADLFSPEAFLESGGRQQVSSNIDYEPKLPSLEELTSLLRETTHARAVEIDQDRGHFWFRFAHPGGGASSWGGAPWVILAEPDQRVVIDPRIEVEALFNSDGIVRISDEEAARGARQSDAVHKATGLVWRQYMLRAFDRSVAQGRVKIYARVESALAAFQEIPRDLWPQLDVFDWQHGIALGPDGVHYRSLHAADAHVVTPKQQSIARDEERAIAALAEQLRRNIHLRKSEAMDLLRSLELRISDNGFEKRIWPEARRSALLPARGAPGRKPKS